MDSDPQPVPPSRALPVGRLDPIIIVVDGSILSSCGSSAISCRSTGRRLLR